MKKSSIVKIIKELPVQVDIDELFEKLMVIEKIEKGLDDLKKNKIVPHEKVKNEFLTKWAK